MSRARRPSAEIDIVVDDPAWRKHRGILRRVREASESSLRNAPQRAPRALTVLLSNDRRVRGLNRIHRGKDKPTNVLSFPQAAQPGYLGDVVIAYGVVKKEAAESGKRFADHATHLAVHGVLHLLGYDHEKPKDAAKMEALEISILREMGIGNPYEIRSGD